MHLISYLVPGATALAGVSVFSPPLQAWFAITPADSPTVSGFLYLTLASLAAGMTVSAVRWALLDTLHTRTGLQIPPLDFSQLGPNVEAFSLLIRIHYEHYQFYANMFVALLIAYSCYRVNLGTMLTMGWLDAAFIALELVFFCTSRDTLRKYYARGHQVLSAPRTRRR